MLFWYFPGMTVKQQTGLWGSPSPIHDLRLESYEHRPVATSSDIHRIYLFIYLFIYHLFATSIALGKVKQSTKKGINKYLPIFVHELH
jgi:hypothetical protein